MRLTRTLAGAAMAAALMLGAQELDAQGKGTKGKGNDGKVPPGLAKKGGLPPGQAKKIYRADDGVVVLRDVFGRNGYTVVRTEPYGSSRYVYYRGRDGRVRRAVVRQGSERLYFDNVPTAIVRQVWARFN